MQQLAGPSAHGFWQDPSICMNIQDKQSSIDPDRPQHGCAIIQQQK
jgi:hypothetical protein